MRIRRIEITEFRKIGHLVVPDLEDGINVLVGDNEAGKSTVLAALRAALFDRHRVTGEVVDAMQPYGHKVRPTVTLDFELDGKFFRLTKSFGQRPEAELTGPGERLVGDAVEERLAELLGFVPPGRGLSKPEEHQGVYGLLWVEQGRAHEAPKLGGGRDSIAAALEKEVGQVIGGERGRQLLARAEERRAKFWDKRDRPKSDFKALIDLEARLAAERDEAAARMTALDRKVTDLGRCNEALERYRREERMQRAAEAVASARQAVERAKGLDDANREAEAALERCLREHALAREAQQRRRRLIGAVEEARGAAAGNVARASDAALARDRHVGLAAEAEAGWREARHRRDVAAAVLRGLQLAAGRSRDEEGLRVLEGRLRSAVDAEAEGTGALAQARAIRVTGEDVAALEALDAALRQAMARRDAASVHIRFEPDGGRAITVDGRHHDASEPLRLGRDARIVLGGFGTVLIHPGGGVDDLARAVDAAQRRLSERLVTIGLADVRQARAALDRRLAAEQRAAAQRGMLESLAPEGIEALRLAVETRRIELAVPDRSVGALLPQGAGLTLREAEKAHDVAAAKEQAAEATASSARGLRENASSEAATLAERASSGLRTHDERVRQLADERARQADDALDEALQSAGDALAASEALVTRTRSALAAGQPEVAALQLDMAQKAQDSVARDIQALTREKLVLETELSTLGIDGLGERLAEVGEALEAARDALARAAREAAGARLLHDTLLEAQKETKERWLGPVRERVRPYLKLILPDSDIVLDEATLELKGFLRAGVEEPFERLSVGAREQVAVITRLALADLLRNSGRSCVLVLDDALVNTDAGRLERMHLVLHQAARALQILILTCREGDFVSLGAPMRRI